MSMNLTTNTNEGDAALNPKIVKPHKPLMKKEFFNKNKFLFIAFIVPWVLMLFAFIQEQIFPFGDNQVLVIDMWHQYFPFFKVLQEKLQTGGSLLYTWEGGGGTNFIALISYYATSPLYLLSLFVPAKYLTELMALIVITKISLSSMFMYIYLRSMFKRDGMMTVVFAVSYALSAYAMGYYWCLMWLDVMALLPLCLLGLNKLIDEGKFMLYTFSLAFILITNYYIGVMVCMFIAVYYPILYFSRKKAKGAIHCIKATLKAVGFSIIGAAMSAIILLPTYLSMQNTYYIDQAFPEHNDFYHNILDVINNLLPNVELTVRGGLPNIYCGLFCFIMFILYLMCKKISAKQKILNCTVLAFLLLSFNWNKLDFIWHGFHFPNELPFRYSFAFSFLLITMAAQAFYSIKSITPGQIGAVAGGGFLYLIFVQKLYGEEFDDVMIYVCIGLLGLYAIGLALFKSGRIKEWCCALFVFLIFFGEMTNYTVSSVNAVSHSGRSAYYQAYDDITGLIKNVEKTDESFYRLELASNWTTNDPALYGYRGLSQFSSEINCNVTRVMKSIGLAADPGSNRFGYFISTPVLNSMLNLKYIIGKTRRVNDRALELIEEKNGSTIYKNKYFLSVGYMVNDDIYEWDATDFSNPFETQNQFVWNATGNPTPVLNEIDYDPQITGENATFGVYSNGTVSCTNTGGTTTAHLEYTVSEDQPIYAFVESSGAATITGMIENNDTVTFENNRGAAISLGNAKKGDKVNIDITYEDATANTITSLVYGLDTAAWEAAYEKLNDEILNVTSFSDTSISGTVNVEKNGVLMTSIPYEKGWKVKVDGKSIPIVPVNDAFCSVEMPEEGEHTIEFSYVPDGFIPGLLITVASLLVLFALNYYNRKRNNKLLLIRSYAEAQPPVNQSTAVLSDLVGYLDDDEEDDCCGIDTDEIENLPEITVDNTDIAVDDSVITDENGDIII